MESADSGIPLRDYAPRSDRLNQGHCLEHCAAWQGLRGFDLERQDCKHFDPAIPSAGSPNARKFEETRDCPSSRMTVVDDVVRRKLETGQAVRIARR